MVCRNVLEAINRTPVVELQRVSKECGCRIWAKFEAMNVSGSVKCRSALGMVEAAEKSGRLKPGMTVVEATTGNQGIGVAMVCAVKGYDCIICMPEWFGVERRKIVRAYGGTIVLTPQEPDMKATVRKCRETAFEIEARDPAKYIYLKQFDNPGNPDIHRRTTAAEILMDTRGDFDIFVATLGTGGTITGSAEVLKVAIPALRVYGVEPHAAALEGAGRTALHKQQGIGDGQSSKVLNRSIIDEWVAVHDDEAYEMARRLAREEGIFAGISSGTAVSACLQVAKKIGPGHTIVTILSDTGERYLQDDLWADLVKD